MKKIAVYFTGHYRNLDETWINYLKLFKCTEKYIFNFYFFLWDISDHDRVYTRENNKIYKIREITDNDITKVCKERYRDIKLIKLYKDFEMPLLKNKSGSKQMFMINEAFKYLPDDYDYYVRMRTDLFFFKTDIWDNICVCKSDLILPDTCHGEKRNFPNGVFNDFFWIGNYKGAKFLSLFYDHIELINYDYLEYGIAEYIKNYGNSQLITISQFESDFNLDRRTRGYENWLVETIRDTNKRNFIDK